MVKILCSLIFLWAELKHILVYINEQSVSAVYARLTVALHFPLTTYLNILLPQTLFLCRENDKFTKCWSLNWELLAETEKLNQIIIISWKCKVFSCKLYLFCIIQSVISDDQTPGSSAFISWTEGSSFSLYDLGGHSHTGLQSWSQQNKVYGVQVFRDFSAAAPPGRAGGGGLLIPVEKSGHCSCKSAPTGLS